MQINEKYHDEFKWEDADVDSKLQLLGYRTLDERFCHTGIRGRGA
jgi:hypothetical protein